MPEFSFISPDPAATEAFGRGMARVLRGGEVVLLRGDLGAGKTTLVRAVARGLGVPVGLVSSPTFVVVNQYPLPEAPASERTRGGATELVHVDAYRLGGAGDLESVGWERFVDESGRARAESIVMIEWPERIEGAVDAGAAAELCLEAMPDRDSRRVTLNVPETWSGRHGLEDLLTRAPVRCRTTGVWVEPTNPHYPFADARAKLADLNKWFTGSYSISRPATQADFESGGG